MEEKKVKASSEKEQTRPTPKFENNERVLCFHGPLIYEGKTLKTEYRKEQSEYAYLIHYAGWNKSWDEFVYESRVLKYSEANLERQKELKFAHDEKASRKAAGGKASIGKKKSNVGSDAGTMSATDSRSSTPVMELKGPKGKKDSSKADNTDSDSGKRKKKNESVETETLYSVKQEVQLMLPEPLKLFLVDDWDYVVRQRRLVKLPSRRSVEQVLEDYLQTRAKGDMYAVELCNGLREYFNSMIGSQLLYRYEREQYEEICKKYQKDAEAQEKKQMSEIYGVTHLMRLFTKLGGCLSYTNLDTDAVGVLRRCIDEFLTFLMANYEVYFSLDDYGVSDPEYQRQVPA